MSRLEMQSDVSHARPVAWAVAAFALVAGCTTIAGLDGDYTVGDPALVGGGGSATGGSSAGGNPTQGGGPSTGGSPAQGGGPGQGGGPEGGGGSGGMGGDPLVCSGMHTVAATLADCIDLTSPNPDECETRYGVGELMVTSDSFDLGNPVHSFLVFPLAADVAAGPFTSVTLRLVVPDTDFSNSEDSGEIWQVDPFVRNDLFVGNPTNVGMTPIAPSVGAVARTDTVDFSLPTTGIVANDGSVYLAVRGLSDDGASYMNLNGSTPPQLVIECP